MVLQRVRTQLTQLFPPKPTFTEENVPDLSEKVYMVTGANTGVGKELAQILYAHNATVYVAARSQPKADAAISAIRDAYPSSSGKLVFLSLDLADLAAVKASAEGFLRDEKRLDVLFNNAGVMTPPPEIKTKQGYEMQLGVNNVGTFLFTKLLTPLLVATSKSLQAKTPQDTSSSPSAPASSVRVVWVASSATEAPIVPTGGVNLSDIHLRHEKLGMTCYALSKAGNYLHAVEFAERYTQETGVVSVPLNPGNLDSELWRSLPSIGAWALRRTVLNPPIFGAYTELWAGLAGEVTREKSGEWVGPWGRFLPIRSDLELATKSKEEGGHGTAKAFWEWSEEQVKDFV